MRDIKVRSCFVFWLSSSSLPVLQTIVSLTWDVDPGVWFCKASCDRKDNEMTPRRRKPTSKALDETSEPSPKRLKASSATLSKRQPAPRAAKVNRQDPFWLTTNEKSPLANEDLYTELSDPKTYENFTKSDWDDLRECLPPNVPLSSDGYSIPIDFFKYDADFRRGIREFQEDLSTGRLDPGWQAAAAGAMEERARGDFDAHKENQFEEFWGQKQKLDRLAVAGESAKLKLDVMIQNGIFQAGDFLSYSRAMRTVNGKLLVEKECEVRLSLHCTSRPEPCLLIVHRSLPLGTIRLHSPSHQAS